MRNRSRARTRRPWTAAAACLVASALGLACPVIQVRREDRVYREVATLRGTVRTVHPSTHPLVVVLGHPDEVATPESALALTQHEEARDGR